jgi:hypothetical protein
MKILVISVRIEVPNIRRQATEIYFCFMLCFYITMSRFCVKCSHCKNAVTLLTCIREEPISNLCQEVGHPGRLFVFFFTRSTQVLGHFYMYLNFIHGRFLPHLS